MPLDTEARMRHQRGVTDVTGDNDGASYSELTPENLT